MQGRAMEPRKKILCIEDDRETAALIGEELADRGFEPMFAFGGQEGFVAILKHRPDLVLCDINMPTMSGFEVLQRLIELAPALGHIPFVFLTALADRENELHGRRLGADDYVTKPIDFDVLHAIINARLASVARNEIWPKLTALHDREIEMLTWVARGKTSTDTDRGGDKGGNRQADRTVVGHASIRPPKKFPAATYRRPGA